ncbi:MAG: hypothetical protein P0Y65_08375 [Candidatus Devosia phytovorans]|uniref:Uncharacterized protein n=1 Tax=Candidatus Devosia phytovorans TaxID=3121372 RepID=A0AAJ6B106_9HYPH|nr:hypothetical protein [Devosia sp.]WEK06245.1 MAG: hypothetical protein P0Y65_08375 [Devosia sp.]
MSVLLGVILLFMVLTLVVAVLQAVAIIRVAPASENLAGFMPLGWWKFRQLAQKAGPAAAQPLNIYKRAVIAFVVFLLLGLALSSWSVNRPATPAETAMIDHGRAVPAFHFDLRRVALMPGAQNILES